MAQTVIWLELVKVAPLFLGGGFALYRYVQDQNWRRQQFATSLYKEFAAKDTTRKAMMMIDWERDIELYPERKGRKSSDLVIDGDLVDALRINNLVFSEKEVRIRDIFDAFFTDLAEFEHHIASGLIDTAQIAPYLAYWAKQLTGRGHLNRDEVWRQMHRFIEHYDYKSVESLLSRMGFEYPAHLSAKSCGDDSK